MADAAGAAGDAGRVVMHRVGPLPLVAWVAGGAGLLFLVLRTRSTGSSNAAAARTAATTTAASATGSDGAIANDGPAVAIQEKLATLSSDVAGGFQGVTDLSNAQTAALMGNQNAVGSSVVSQVTGNAAGQSSLAYGWLQSAIAQIQGNQNDQARAVIDQVGGQVASGTAQVQANQNAQARAVIGQLRQPTALHTLAMG